MAKIGGFTIVVVTVACIFLAWLINWFFNHAHPINLNPFGKSLTEAAPYGCQGFWGHVVPWCYLQSSRQLPNSATWLDPSQQGNQIIFPDDVWIVAFNMNAGDVFTLQKLPIIEEGCWIHRSFPPPQGRVTVVDHSTHATYTAHTSVQGYRILLHFVNSPETVPQGGVRQSYVQCFR